MSQLTVRKTGSLTLRGSLRPLIFAAGLVTLSTQISGAGSNPGQQTFGSGEALHVVVGGNSTSGYRAEIYDRNQLVATRGLAGKYDLTVFPGTSDNQPSGPNILTDPTVVGSWQGPFQNGVGSVPGTIAAATTPGGTPAIQWTMTNAAPQTWIQIPMLDSPLPAVGVSNSSSTYGMAAASTWDEPMPGYSGPHLIINGQQLSAPQIGTQSFPISLTSGQSVSFTTVFFKGGPGTYGLALGAELAKASALGLTGNQGNALLANQDLTQSAMQAIAQREFATIAKVTAYWLRESSSNGFALAPSQHYGTSTYARDSFWTTYGLQGTPFQAETETMIFNQFTNAIPTSGSNAGHVPVTSGGPYFEDESGLYYLIRMYRDSEQWGLSVKNLSTAQLVLNYIQSNQVNNGQFITAGPINNAGFEITPDTWLDGYLFPVGAVSAYNQGLYVVALQACQKLGLPVTNDQIAAALTVYQGLYDPQLGYIRWLSTQTYKGPDVLAGDALSLFLWNRPLLSDTAVRNTLNAQARTQYGMEVLAEQNGTSVPANQFLTLTNNPTTGAVEGIPEPGGWYQNGGSWLLWEFLAEYSALRHGDFAALQRIQQSIAAEVAVTPLSKEFKVTINNPAIASVDPAWPYPLGSCGLDRQGFGWNTALAAFLSSMQH